jgi:transcriptional regulator GlxA family with amidase domain
VGHGAGSWTNRDDGKGARRRTEWGMPASSYFASGWMGGGADATVGNARRKSEAERPAIDLVLWLVRRVAGPQVAELCVRYLVTGDRTSQAHHALVDHLRHDSDVVRRAEAHVRRHLSHRIPVAELARAAGASPRTLARRTHEALGLSPLGLMRRVRAERAAHLLATTRESFERIAACVGYGDAGTLRELLRRELDVTARALRRR